MHSKNLLGEKDKKDPAEAFSFTSDKFFLVSLLVYILENYKRVEFYNHFVLFVCEFGRLS